MGTNRTERPAPWHTQCLLHTPVPESIRPAPVTHTHTPHCQAPSLGPEFHQARPHTHPSCSVPTAGGSGLSLPILLGLAHTCACVHAWFLSICVIPTSFCHLPPGLGGVGTWPLPAIGTFSVGSATCHRTTQLLSSVSYLRAHSGRRLAEEQ